MRRLAILLVVLVGGLTAVPGTAFATTYGPYPGGNGWVNYDEAVYLTVYTANTSGYHGGALRWNLSRYAPWGGQNGQDVELNVRFGDGSLGRSWVSNPCDGAGCLYYVELYPR